MLILATCIHGIAWTQPAPAMPELRMSGIVHPNREMADKHVAEEKLWKAIVYKIDEDKGEIEFVSSGLVAPRPQNEIQSTLVLEYETVSGQILRVPSETPWHHISGATIPTDEDATAIRVYSTEGKLIAEYRGSPFRFRDVRGYELARIGTDKLGFHDHGRHVWKDRWSQKGFNPSPACDIRWSWDGGKSWTDPKSVRGDDAITWVLTPEILERLKENPDPLIEIIHSLGMKVIRKTYHFLELPTVKNEAPQEVN